MHFVCTNCESRLTAELAEVDSESLISEENQTDYVPQGFALLERREFWTRHQGYWCIHANDKTGMKMTQQDSRTNGCCGPDGCDGPNMLCATCGHEVATAKFDCWMPHCVLLEPTGTRVVN